MGISQQFFIFSGTGRSAVRTQLGDECKDPANAKIQAHSLAHKKMQTRTERGDVITKVARIR